MRLAALATACALLGSAPVAPAVDATQASLTDVLTKANAARGTLASLGVSEAWDVMEGGLSGQETDVDIGDDYRDDRTFRRLHTAYGRLGERVWSQNENGYVVFDSGVHQRDDANARALQAARDGPTAGVKLLGETSMTPIAYVVEVSPPDGRPEYRFYDKTSYLLLRKERYVGDLKIVTSYDDYRLTEGVMRPWHIHVSDGRPHNDSDRYLKTVEPLAARDESKVAIPGQAHTPLTLGTARVMLPARIVEDRIILTAQIAGRKVNLQLDSGASGILVDRSVMDALKIESFGAETEATAGTYVAGHAIVPKMEFGAASLNDVAVETAPFVEFADPHTPVAGLAGFDLIAGCVVAIDYQGGTVEAIDQSTFTPPEKSVVIPIRLDDYVPMIDAQIGTSRGKNFILDTGADRSMLFTDFVTAHPADTKDQGLGTAMQAAFPFIEHISGVGGKVEVRPVQVSSLGIGSIALPRWLFLAIDQTKRSFEGEDFDGLIGQDVLRNFVVYLDYAHLRIYLVPNERFRQRYG